SRWPRSGRGSPRAISLAASAPTTDEPPLPLARPAGSWRDAHPPRRQRSASADILADGPARCPARRTPANVYHGGGWQPWVGWCMISRCRAERPPRMTAGVGGRDERPGWASPRAEASGFFFGSAAVLNKRRVKGSEATLSLWSPCGGSRDLMESLILAQ